EAISRPHFARENSATGDVLAFWSSPSRVPPRQVTQAFMKVLFVTRKYPPMVGGMEALSYFLTTGFPEPKKIVSLGRAQLHLSWFLPSAPLRVALTAPFYDVVHLGDPVLAVVGVVPRFLFRRPVMVTVHGLDITFESKLYQWYSRRFLRGSAYLAIS